MSALCGSILFNVSLTGRVQVLRAKLVNRTYLRLTPSQARPEFLIVVSTSEVGTFNRWVTRAALNRRALRNRTLPGSSVSRAHPRLLASIPMLLMPCPKSLPIPLVILLPNGPVASTTFAGRAFLEKHSDPQLCVLTVFLTLLCVVLTGFTLCNCFGIPKNSRRTTLPDAHLCFTH